LFIFCPAFDSWWKYGDMGVTGHFMGVKRKLFLLVKVASASVWSWKYTKIRLLTGIAPLASLSFSIIKWILYSYSIFRMVISLLFYSFVLEHLILMYWFIILGHLWILLLSYSGICLLIVSLLLLVQLASHQMTSIPGSGFFWRNVSVCFQLKNHLWSADVEAIVVHLLKLSKFQLVLASQKIWCLCNYYVSTFGLCIRWEQCLSLLVIKQYLSVAMCVIFSLEAYYSD